MVTMKSLQYLKRGLLYSSLFYFSIASWPLAQAQQACEKLKDLKLTGTSVQSADSIPSGPLKKWFNTDHHQAITGACQSV